jgi:hypothetical protein
MEVKMSDDRIAVQKFFLNEIVRENSKLPKPPSGGLVGDTDLKKYINSIKIQEFNALPEYGLSYPSIFARPILFKRIFEWEDHPLHNILIDEWKGLLSIFALREQYGFKIDIIKYDLNTIKPEHSIFMRPIITMIKSQLPKTRDAKAEEKWSRLYLIYCNGRLVGATSPWTVFFTPAEYSVKGIVRWCREDGRLDNPVNYFKKEGASTTLFNLVKWVEKVNENCKKTEIEHNVHKILDSFIKEINENIGELDLGSSPDFGEEGHLGLEEPYSSFDIYIKKFIQKNVISVKGEKNIIYISSNDEDKLVLDPFTGNDIKNKRDKNNKIFKYNDAEYTCIFPEYDFLTDKIAKFDLSTNNYFDFNKYTIPLSKCFFDHFDYKDIVDKNGDKNIEINIKEEGKDRLKVELRLYGKLFSKEYYGDKIVNIDNWNISLGIWPNFYTDDWKLYFSSCIVSQDSLLKIDPIILNDEESKSKCTFANWDIVRNEANIYHSEKPIVGFYINQKNESLGVILIQGFKEVKKFNDNELIIALDFGTSNTNIMKKESGSKSVEMKFENRYLPIIRGYKNQMNELLLFKVDNDTDKGTNIPFPTLCIDFSDVNSNNNKCNKYYPFFITPSNEFVGKIKGDIKWGSGGTKEDLPSTHYLRGLFWMIMAEARAEGIKKVRLIWSYPISMPKPQIDSMKQFWESCVRGSDKPTNEIEFEQVAVSESEAICKHFAKSEPVYSSDLTIIIDVGGGSTDIGVWQTGKIIRQMSFKFASGDLFNKSHWLPDLIDAMLEAIKKSGKGDYKDEWGNWIKALAKDKSHIAISNLLSRPFGIQWRGSISDHPVIIGMNEVRDEYPWKQQRTVIFTFFLGIVFFLGLFSKILLDREKNNREKDSLGKDTDKKPRFNINFGGLGSALLYWIYPSEVEPKRIKEDLEKAFKEGIGDSEIDVTIGGTVFNKSKDDCTYMRVKSQVAEGLLSETTLESAGEDEIDKVIVGEKGYLLKTSEVKFGDILRIDILSNIILVNVDGTYFSTFRNELRNMIREREKRLLDNYMVDINITTSDIENTINQVAKNISEESSQSVLMPLFIYELRTLIERYGFKNE